MQCRHIHHKTLVNHAHSRATVQEVCMLAERDAAVRAQLADIAAREWRGSALSTVCRYAGQQNFDRCPFFNLHTTN